MVNTSLSALLDHSKGIVWELLTLLIIRHIFPLEVCLVLPDLGRDVRWNGKLRAMWCSHQPSLSGYFRSGIRPARKLPNYAWLPAMPPTSQRGPNWRAADLCPWTTGSHISSQNIRSCTPLTNLEWHRIFHIRPRFLKVTFCVPRPSCLSVDFLGLYIAPGWLINRHALCHRPCQSDRPFQPVPNLTYTQTFPKPHKRV